MIKIVNITSLTLIGICHLPRKRDRLVFVALFSQRNFRTSNARESKYWTYFKSREELGEALDLSPTSVRNALSYLQKEGWLSKPETKLITNPDLVGDKVRVYRWRFPKHEAEYSHAKAYIAEQEAKNEDKRQKAKQAANGNGNGNGHHDDDRPTDILPGGLKVLEELFSEPS